MTDHGSMAGVLYHVKDCEEAGIRPIVGMEAYFRWDAKVHDKDTNWAFNHLVLLAKSEEGFKNLMRLSSASYNKENFYRKPCVDLPMLREHSEGIMATSACAAGPLAREFFAGNGAERQLTMFLDIFKDDFFMEIQPHAWEGQVLLNVEIANLARTYGVPLIATCDAHYVKQEDYSTHQVLVAIATNTTLSKRQSAAEQGEDVLFSGQNSLYLMSEQEMEMAFASDHPSLPNEMIREAIDNTVMVADRVEPYEVSKEPKMPKATRSTLEAERMLREWCREGLERIGKAGDPVYEDRLEREIKVIRARQALDYFIIVGDMVRKAKRRGIRVGPGRGSAAGSLVAYLSRITGIDPIGYDLVFERFMSEYRIEMPDIDIDFQHTKRDSVKEDLKNVWGHDHVNDVAAFSTFQMKSAVRDVSRVYDIPYGEAGHVAKEIDAQANRHVEQHLEDMADGSADVRAFSTKYPEAWRDMCKLEGQIKGISKHPAAVVITDKPVSEYMPTMRAADGVHTVTQWAERADFHVITNYGFLKIDVLSIDGLTAQDHTIRLIKERHGVEIDFEDPKMFPEVESPFNAEPAVLEFFAKGPYLGIHQFMSSGITQLLKDIKPSSIDDIIAANALFRPGPIKSGICFEYPKLKNGETKPREWHPLVAPYLERTFGLIVYQEQVMAIIAELGGFDKQESYIVFKSMTKWHVSKQRGIKGTEKLKPLVDKFISGCVSHGIVKKEAMRIWEGIAAMSHYSFNRSHSAGYGIEAYQDGWLKVHYPLEFYASLLTWEKEKVPRVVREARSQGIKVLPPDVNVSTQDFVISGDAIRFGLGAVKGVGDKAVEEILRAREDGPFASTDDLRARTEKRKCNTRVMKSLHDCGAFDSLGGREGILSEERAALERQLIGYALTTKDTWRSHKKLIEERVSEPDQFIDENDVFVGGEIVRVNEFQTKKGQAMAFVDIELGEKEFSVTFFTRALEECREMLQEGDSILVKGKWQEARLTVVADDVCTADQYAQAVAGAR